VIVGRWVAADVNLVGYLIYKLAGDDPQDDDKGP
jgi:hypothetical protein